MAEKYTVTEEDIQYYFHEARVETGNTVRGVIVFVHGLRDHSGTHTFFFEQLNEEGFHVLSFDLLGHGYSAGERCTIHDYRQHVHLVWRSIIRGLRQHTPPRIPVVVMGYSYGFSLVVHALHELISHHASVEKIITRRVALVVGLSPAFKVSHTASPVVRFFAPLLSFLSRHVRNIPFMPMNLENITDDREILKVIEADPQVFRGRISVHTARNVDIAGRAALRILPGIRLPFLLLFGSRDFVLPVTAEEVENRDDVEIRIIRGGKHNIFDGNNLYAGRTLESILRAIEKYC